MDYIEVDGQRFKISQRRIRSADGQEYRYYRVKVNAGRHSLTNAARQIDVIGRSTDELRERIIKVLRFSPDEAGLIDTSVTLDEWFHKGFEFRKNAIEPESAMSEEIYYRLYIAPFLSGYRITELSEDTLIKWQEQLLQEGKSERGIYVAVYILSRYLELAVRHRYLNYNPASYCRIVNRTRMIRRCISDRTLKHFLIDLADEYNSTMIAFMLLTAARVSEMLGLSWKDIDFEQRLLTIHQQVLTDKNSSRVIGIRPYTKGKRPRTICLPQAAIWYLERQKRLQAEWGSSDIGFENKYDLVFTDSKGGAIPPVRLRKWFIRNLDEYDKAIHMHDLRRTCVTGAYSITGDIFCVKQVLGHMDLFTTYEYLEYQEDRSVSVAECMNAYWEKIRDLAEE